MSTETALRGYKKRIKAQQRRISTEKGINKRLKLLLIEANEQLPNGLLKDMISHELKKLKYKYL